MPECHAPRSAVVVFAALSACLHRAAHVLTDTRSSGAARFEEVLATLHDLWPPAPQLPCNKLVVPLRHSCACTRSLLQLVALMLRGLLQHWKSAQGASRHFSTQARSMGVKVFIIYYSMCVPCCLMFSCFLGHW